MKKILTAAFCFTLIFITALMIGYASAEGEGAGGSKSDGGLFPKWTWISGDEAVGQHGVYGSQGVPSTTNKPGGRSGSASWTDTAGNLWLFGGIGPDASGNDGALNDLWKLTF